MVIHLDRQLAVLIGDPRDFSRFHIRIEAEPRAIERVRIALTGLATLESPEQAWVAVEALRARTGLADDPAWAQAFANMVEKARSFGWVRDEPLRLAAHAVWQDVDRSGSPSPPPAGSGPSGDRVGTG